MNTDSMIHAVAVLVVAASLLISITYRRRAAQAGDKIDVKEEGSLILYLRRVFGLALWISILAYLVNPAWLEWSMLPLPTGLRWAGVTVMLLCLPLVYWVFSSLGKNVTQTVVTRQEHSLVTSGPYRWVRHPLYSVGFLMFSALSLASGSWFIGLSLLLGMIPLALRTPIEEARLIERFGDEYRAYMQRTGRYLPRLAADPIEGGLR